MKKQAPAKKLSLNKETVANLNTDGGKANPAVNSIGGVGGGCDTPACPTHVVHCLTKEMVAIANKFHDQVNEFHDQVNAATIRYHCLD